MHTDPYPKYILRNIVISGTSVAGGGNLPSGGTTGQYLRKISSTDYDTEWGTLTVSGITDLTASATELNYTDGVTSSIQTQLNAKLGTSLTSANIIVGNGSNVATAVAMTGDIAITNTGVTSIGSGVIVNADVNASAAIAVSKLAAVTASRALVSDGSGFISTATTTATEIGYVNGVTSSIQTQLNAKLTSSLTSANVFVGNGSNIATGVAISGDVTISNTGVVAIAGGVIVNADVNASAAIAVSKLAAVTASRALASDGSGFITPSATTSTELGYVSGVTSAIQDQLDDLIATQPVNSVVQAPTSGEDGYAITWDDAAGEYTLTDPIIQGLPAGGATDEVLVKLSGTNYDADWRLLVLTDVSDVTATTAEINILDGATLSTTELNYVDGVTSSIQTQLDNKLGNTLAQHAIFVGNASNVAAAVAAGSSGQVLTVVGGVPSWATPSVGASGGSANELQKNDGASGFAGTKIFSTANGDATLGDAGLAGATRTITTTGSASDVGLAITTKGSGPVTITSGGLNVNASGTVNEIDMGSLVVTSDIVGPEFIVNTSLTNTVGTGLTIGLITTDTPAAGIGTEIVFEVETSSGNSEQGAHIEVITTDVTPASEDFDLVFKTMTAGSAATEKLRVASTGVLTIPNASTNAAAASTGGLILHSRDSSDANSTLAIYAEQAPEATATFTQTHRFKIYINGTEYWLSLDAV